MTDRPDPHEVTIGEVYRLNVRIDQRLDQITKDMVGRQEYEADHEATADALKDLRNVLAQERSEREAGDRRIVESAANAKRWAVTTAIGGGSLLLAGLGFIITQLTGGPA